MSVNLIGDLKMKLKLPHVPYVANKVAIDLLASPSIQFTKGVDEVKEIVCYFLEEDLGIERELEVEVEKKLDSNEDEIEFMRVDRRNLFWLAKKKLAYEQKFELNFDDRYSIIATDILSNLTRRKVIKAGISENQIKNIIFNAMMSYMKSFEKIETDVADKIDSMEKSPRAGSEEYEMLFEKLYKMELAKKGLL